MGVHGMVWISGGAAVNILRVLPTAHTGQDHLLGHQLLSITRVSDIFR